jgi:hypothetical protein
VIFPQSKWVPGGTLSEKPNFAHVRFALKERDPDADSLADLAAEVCAMLKPRIEASGDFESETQRAADRRKGRHLSECAKQDAINRHMSKSLDMGEARNPATDDILHRHVDPLLSLTEIETVPLFVGIRSTHDRSP